MCDQVMFDQVMGDKVYPINYRSMIICRLPITDYPLPILIFKKIVYICIFKSAS